MKSLPTTIRSINLISLSYDSYDQLLAGYFTHSQERVRARVEIILLFKMLSRRLVARAAHFPRTSARARSIRPTVPFSTVRALQATSEEADAELVRLLPLCDSIAWLTVQDGGYVNPTNHPFPLKRQFRDPYYPWWDKQERRNFGEPVHEDNDILGMFSLEEYTHMKPARVFLLWGGFIACVLGLTFVVKLTYPDRPSAPKEYPDGLEAELGGPGAVRVGTGPIWNMQDANYLILGMESW